MQAQKRPFVYNPYSRTICLNSERSEQFLVTECFFNLFLEVSQIYQIRTIRIQIGKILGFRNMQEKLEKDNSCLGDDTILSIFWMKLSLWDEILFEVSKWTFWSWKWDILQFKKEMLQLYSTCYQCIKIGWK